MNENENIIETPDYDDDWSDIVITDEDIAGDTENADEDVENIGEAKDTEKADQPDGEKAEQTEQPAEENAEKEADQFVLKHLGEEKTVNREDVITLAQKGLDYDRIRGKHDELSSENASLKEQMADYEHVKEQLGYFEEMAKASNITIDELIVQTVAAQRAAKNGTSVDDEISKARLEVERKAFEKEKTSWEKSKGTEQNAADEQAKIMADLELFAAEFPEAAKDIKNNIPQEVWDAIDQNGTTLTEEFRKYTSQQKDAEIASLKSQLEQKAQNEKNKERSTGSQSTGSISPTGDIWDEAWAND